MARVLVCADGFFRAFSPFALEPYIESFIKVLARHGNDVLPVICQDFQARFSWRRKLYRYQAAWEIKKFDPEIIFTFNNAFPSSFFKYFRCPIFIVASDTPVYWSNKGLLKKYSSQYSVLYFNAGMANTLRTEYAIPAKRQVLIPYSTDMHSDKSISFKKDITFIGNFYNTDGFLFGHLLNALEGRPEPEKQKVKESIVRFIDTLKQQQEQNDKTLECYTKLQVPGYAGYDLTVAEVFAALTAEKRLELLSSLADMDLHIYTWAQNFKCICNFYSLFRKCHLEPVYSAQKNERIYNESKISLSLPHAQVHTGFSWRVCDILASNAMLLANPTADLQHYFGGIVPTYRTAAELKDKCRYFLSHEAERADIVQACQTLIDKNHRYENVFQVVENYTGIKLLQLGLPRRVRKLYRTRVRQNRYQKGKTNG